MGNTNTAALFLGLLQKLLKGNGINGYIIPKSFIYASNWQVSRELMIDYLFELVDCGKVWKDVKLEQVITLFKKDLNQDNYITSVREDTEIKRIGNIDKKTFNEFDFYLNGISNEDLNIAVKMKSSNLYFNDIIINKRGAGYQKICIDEIPENKKYYKVLGGKNISRYFYNDNYIKYISGDNNIEDKAMINNNSILVQNIVAHIMNPVPHIKIIAIHSSMLENINDYLILDTVNQLYNKSDFDIKFILGVLNSKLLSWYTYIFIFGKSIRTMHFDSVVTAKIPIPQLDLKNKQHKEMHDKIVNLVDNIIALNKKLAVEKNPNAVTMINRQINAVDKQIDALVYKLYNLSDEEVRIIEGE
ncbi:hypothetical protein OFR29_05695 [Brachyspira hyodysenteriae]|nr:TaqI-like C-terminal specificity domain-containing protein [Brachyspira hyodysenteriae]MCZ9989342.1 hypothetical protein [Brachyspira hyodysenteriae]MDA0019115.1 hypothetical protein [Brachyspira hyodysenteriae]MDA0028976.1 hypothetical protein [Brachyspira hyodysenteriae]